MSNSKAEELVEKILDKMHPIGSIYMTMDANSPSVYLGGTWEKIEERFLLASSSSGIQRIGYPFNNNKVTFLAPSNNGEMALMLNQRPYYVFTFTELNISIGDKVEVIIDGTNTYIYVNNIQKRTINFSPNSVSIGYEQYNTNTTGGEAIHFLTNDELPSHRHALNGRTWAWEAEQQGTADVSMQASAIGGYPGYNYMTTYRGTNHSTNPVGSGQEHNNMPPYLVVNIWKRTL